MRHRIFLQTACLTLLFVLLIAAILTMADGAVLDGGVWILLAAALFSALALPWRAATAWLIACALVAIAIRGLNEAKISLTDMPLTFLDLRIALANPAGFAGAMKLSLPVAGAIGGAAALLALAAVGWRASRLRWRDVRGNALPRVVAIACAGLLASVSVTLFAKRLQAAVLGHEYAEIANMPDGMVLIARKLGSAPFLVLTAGYDAASPSPFRDLASREMQAPTAAVVEKPPYLKPFQAPAKQPDVFVVLLESTFDLPRVFDTAPPLASNLFPNSQQGQLQGELSVNAIGGGTWISEFEAITGIPSRLFGYAGYYTHVALGPYVKGSFATYLKARGYATTALYPVEGQFYGARAAYGHYGFDSYHDGVELRIEKPWFAEDTDIMSKYIGAIRAIDTSKPLFAFALTMENHSPHPCVRFGSEAEMPYRLVGDTDKRATCELNEYIARYRSTETAIAMLEDFLREREKASGRPWVLAVFGDHQPNTFTGTAKTPFWSPYDYSKLRHASNDVTFYQIRSSLPSPFATATLDTSVVMLPTLLSAYVAKDSRDVYLPGNFEIQAQCGTKISLPRLNTAYGKDAMIPESEFKANDASDKLTHNCQSALVAARSDYLSLIEMP
jgi:phosphoglycerol transferase MdoB-like AlkP superfamily enzyme